MAYQLEFGRGDQRGAVIPLPKEPGESLFVGRGPHFAIFSKNISRKQIEITLVANDRADKNGFIHSVQVKRIGVNPSVIVRKASQVEILMLQNKSYKLHIGDTIFLIPSQYPLTLGSVGRTDTPEAIMEKKASSINTTMPKLEDPDKENRPPIPANIVARPSFTTPQPTRSRSIQDFFTPPLKRKYPFASSSQMPALVDSPTTSKARKLSRIFSSHSLEKIKSMLKQAEGDEQLAADALLNDTQPLELSQESLDVMNDKKDEEEQEEEEEEEGGGLETSLLGLSDSNHNNNNSVPLQGESIVYKLNHLPGFSPSANESTVHIRHLIQDELQAAVLTTYKVEMGWLLEQCPVLKKVPFTLIHGETRVIKNPPGCHHINIFKPELPLAYGVNHGKVMLLYYPAFLRVVVSTANLLQRDYERKTQGVWFQDFFPKHTSGTTCDFEDTLVDYFERLGLTAAKDLRNYDYSTAKVVLVSSVPGYHSGSSLYKYGHMKVRKMLENEDVPIEFTDSPVVCQFSSVGSLTRPWLEDELLASFATSASGEHTKAELQLVWPSIEMVRNSVDGYEAGHSLCLAESNNKGLLKPFFTQYVPNQKGREHVTPHIKTYLRYQDGAIAWVCLTSANMSKAAWGSLQKKGTQLMVRHFEMGVLFLPSLVQHSAFVFGQQSSPGDSVVPPSFAIPFSMPLEPFTYEGDNQPWVFDKSYSEPDHLGKRYRHHAKSYV